MLLETKELFDARYVFIDGISRSGKGALAPIVSSINNAEHFKSNYNFDKIVFLLETKKLSEDGFKYYLQSDLIMDSWYTLIGRNQNTNAHDLTSIRNSNRAQTYLQREKMNDTAETFRNIAQEISEKNIIFPYITDDFFLHYESIMDSVPKCHFLVVMRHPIELIYAWWKSGRGERFGNDMRLLHPTFRVEDNTKIPYFATTFPNEYSAANAIERCALSILTLQNAYLKKIKTLYQNVTVISFEKLCTNHVLIVDQLEKNLQTHKIEISMEFLEKIQIPRALDYTQHKLKAKFIFENIGDNTRDKVLTAIEEYSKMFPDTYTSDYSDIDNINSDLLTTQSNKARYFRGKRLNID